MAEDIALLKARVSKLTDDLALAEKKNRAYRNEVHTRPGISGTCRTVMLPTMQHEDGKRFSSVRLISTLEREFDPSNGRPSAASGVQGRPTTRANPSRGRVTLSL